MRVDIISMVAAVLAVWGVAVAVQEVVVVVLVVAVASSVRALHNARRLRDRQWSDSRCKAARSQSLMLVWWGEWRMTGCDADADADDDDDGDDDDDDDDGKVGGDGSHTL